MSAGWKRIRDKAVRDPETTFTTLYHHVCNVDLLRECFHNLKDGKAVGVDGVKKSDYAVNLEDNLEDLSGRLKRQGYRPQPSRRSYIPKAGSWKGRPLGISALEDKIVQMALTEVLEGIYEEQFLPCSYGYRRGRSQHDCLQAIGSYIQKENVNHVVEADIRSFFDKVSHEWLLKFLGHRIGDPRIITLVGKMLRAGVMEDGLVKATEMGTPQGSIISPLLSNIYLHYALDLWFKIRVKPRLRGKAELFRFADDFIVCFQFKDDAEDFESNLNDRLEGFELKVAQEKTHRLEFGPYAKQNAKRRSEKAATFEFLGFQHYCGLSRYGKFKIKRRTSPKKLKAALERISTWLRSNRNRLRKGELLRGMKIRINGHLCYYSITDNSKQCAAFVFHATRLLFKWINRKSQRKAYTWRQFNAVLRQINYPRVKVKVNLCPFKAKMEQLCFERI